MDTSLLLPLIIFIITMSITPGPNNIMLTASGANFGFMRTIPHIFGIITGLALLNIMSSLGLSRVFEVYPRINTLLKAAGVSYLLYLAVKIATSTTIKEGEKESKPLNFFQAMLFQALNPKAVIMSITAMTLYTVKGGGYKTSVLTIIVLFLILGFFSISLWALFGSIIKRTLENPKYLRIFNYSMGLLCGLSAILLIF